ncbi:MAG: sigma-70 family RNA polymerase sigma factor [Myxococcota bacterium]
MFGWHKDKTEEFSDLAVPLMDALYGTALKLCRDEQIAQDLVQDTYLKAYKYFHSFKRGTNFKAWIFKILTRNFYDSYKSNKKRNAVFTPLDEGRAADNSVQISRGEQKQLARDLEKALEQVPPDFRLPIILSDVHEFSYKEISEIIDCPIGTVMSRLYRGRKRLKNIILRMDSEVINSHLQDGAIIPMRSE